MKKKKKMDKERNKRKKWNAQILVSFYVHHTLGAEKNCLHLIQKKRKKKITKKKKHFTKQMNQHIIRKICTVRLSLKFAENSAVVSRR